MQIRIYVFLLMTVFLLPAATTQAQTAPDASLASTVNAARWRQRVLLICAPTATDAQLLKQRTLLHANRSGLAKRDVRVRELVLPELLAADRDYLRWLGVKTDTFQVLLLGKDGGVKRRDSRPVAPESLFGLIDQMPMRRQEMRNER